MEEAKITASGSSDLTIMGLFFAADPVVKLVMLLLVGKLVLTWRWLDCKGFCKLTSSLDLTMGEQSHCSFLLAVLTF